MTARLLGPYGRGQFAAAQVWPAIVASVALLGMNNSLALRAARFRDRVATLERSAVGLGALSSLVVVALSWFLVPIFLPADNPSLLRLTRFYLIYVPIFVVTSNLMAIDQGSGNFKQFNLARNVLTPVYLILLCWLWVFGMRNVQWFLGALLLANSAVLFVRGLRIKRGEIICSRNNVHLHGLIRDGMPFWITNCILILRENAERLLLMFLLGPATLGLFVVAVTAAGAHLTVTKSLNLVVFSRAAALDESHALRDSARLFRILGLVNFTLGVGMVMVQPFLIPLIFGKAFIGAVPAAMLLVVGQFFQSQGSILQEAMRGQARPFIGLIGVGWGMAIFGSIGYWLASGSGLLGVAIASTCGQAAYCVFMIAAFKIADPGVDLLVRREDGKRLLSMVGEGTSAILARLTAAKAG